MKFLIVGFGSIGRRHFRNLLTLGERDILLYRTHQGTLENDELEGFPVETDIDVALEHQPDAVIIANPSAYHLDVAIPAARQGCHILLEKPISHSMQRVEEFSQLVQENGVKVMLGVGGGFFTGLLAGSLGVGGGFIRMPMLVYVLGIPTHVAVGTDLFEIVFSSAYGTITHAIKGNVDILMALVMQTGAAIGAQIGATATRFFAGPKIRLAFSVLPLLGAIMVVVRLLGGTMGH